MGIVIGNVPSPEKEVKKVGKVEYVVAATETPAVESENVEEVSTSEEPVAEEVQEVPVKGARKPRRDKKGK